MPVKRNKKQIVDLSVTLSALVPYLEFLAGISKEAKFLVTIEELVKTTAPELISGDVDSMLTAIIDFHSRKQNSTLVSKYITCRERLRKYRSARPDVQSLFPFHTEGHSLQDMHDEVMVMKDIQDIIEYASENPDILSDESLARLEKISKFARENDPYQQIGLLYCERLGILQLLGGLQKEFQGSTGTFLVKIIRVGSREELPNSSSEVISLILRFIWMGASDVISFAKLHPEFSQEETYKLIKKASQGVTDNDTRLIITLRRCLILLPLCLSQQAEYTDSLTYAEYEQMLLSQCEGEITNMINQLIDDQIACAVADMIDFVVHDAPHIKAELMALYRATFPNQ